MPHRRSQLAFYVLTAVILVTGFIFWQSALTSDPPMYYSGLGQSLATDPPYLVDYAPPTLRVCWSQFDDLNCTRCYKCRFSLLLILEGVDPNAYGFTVDAATYAALRRDLTDRLPSTGQRRLDAWRSTLLRFTPIVLRRYTRS